MTTPMNLSTRAIGALALLALSTPVASAGEGLPLVGAVTDRSWVFETEYLSPRGEFQESIRDLDAVSVSAMRSWRFSSGFEAQLGAGLFSAEGTTSELFSGDPPRDSDALGLRAGGRIRYNFPELGPVRPFADGYAGVLWTPGNPFPAGGTAVNGIASWGGGAEIGLSKRWSVEAGWRNTHISNGGGLVDHNPAWDSSGPVLGLRRTLGRAAGS
jgi:opacity protein-like surface antigen